MSHRSDPGLLVLHAVRTLGYADIARIAARARLSEHEVNEHLLDAQANGWITWSTYAGDGGWSSTEEGKAHGEHLLAAELDATGARSAVEAVYRDFLPVNDLVVQACAQWQLAEMGISEEPVSLDATSATLQQAATALETVQARLTSRLERFGRYHSRFTAALSQATADPGWITGTDRESAHRVWFDLHEDLIATLGLTR